MIDANAPHSAAPKTRPSIRVHAEDFKCTVTVSGDRVYTGVLTWYRNGNRFLTPHREILRVESRER